MNKNRIKRTILYAVWVSVGSIIISGCDSDDAIETGSGNKLSIVVNSALATRSLVEGTSLPDKSEIGLFVTNSNGGDYDGEDYVNVKWTASGEGDLQTWTGERDKEMSSTEGMVYAYYPYDSSVTDLTAIPVTAKTGAEIDDYMYAADTSVSQDDKTAELTMHHAMTFIRLSLVKGTYKGEGVVAKVGVKGTPLATSATMDATREGAMSNITGSGTEIAATTNFVLSDTEQSVDISAIPTGIEGILIITITIDNKIFTVESAPMICEKGYLYLNTITLDAGNLEINDVSVREWGYSEEGNLQIDMGHLVTIIGDLDGIALQSTITDNVLTIQAVSITGGRYVKEVTYTLSAGDVTQSESDGVRTIVVSNLTDDVTITFNGVSFLFKLIGNQSNMEVKQTTSNNGATITLTATPTVRGEVNEVTGNGLGDIRQTLDEDTGIRTITVTNISSDYIVSFTGCNLYTDWSKQNDGVYYVNRHLSIVTDTTNLSEVIAIALKAEGHIMMLEKNGIDNGSYKQVSEEVGATSPYYYYEWGESGIDQLYIPNFSKLIGNDYGGILQKEVIEVDFFNNIPLHAVNWTNGALSDWNGKGNSDVLRNVNKRNGNRATIGSLMCKFNTATTENCGFSDWYIPSCGQLALIFLHYDEVNAMLKAIGGQEFSELSYWSSSEKNADEAWSIRFYSGRDHFARLLYTNKSRGGTIRFVRDLD